MPWVYDSHNDRSKIMPQDHPDICKQIEAYACTRPWYSTIKLIARFKGQFCYIETMSEKDKRAFPLCRLKYCSRGWSLALFTYSNERYMSCFLLNKKSEGTIQEALQTCEQFII